MEESFNNSKTIQTRIIMPTDLNDRKILFGGKAMQWMDEVAYIAAKRFSKMDTITVSADKIQFLEPANEGEILKIIGEVENLVGIKIKIRVNIYAEDPKTQGERKIISGLFTFVALNAVNKPTRVTLKKS
ncbi:MAG: acyl-CoA thioesterase [Salinivirgaceae bacterium]|nr:acyl-CoA thioesterase [Salinivirgaceae bacterium]MDD4745828.1 acyl-CoA thioesterase [Salinivirgaceae bacterium]MDY0280230.1 acyl-CoA thioesterase [Salinivirgaceae bacterium]